MQFPCDSIQQPTIISDCLRSQVSRIVAREDGDQVRDHGRLQPHQGQGGQQHPGLQGGLGCQDHLHHTEQDGQQCKHSNGFVKKLINCHKQTQSTVHSCSSQKVQCN